MKATKKNERVTELLSRIKKIQKNKELSCEDVRDDLNKGYLARENKVSYHTVVNWLDRQCPPKPNGEVALALLEWIDDNE